MVLAISVQTKSVRETDFNFNFLIFGVSEKIVVIEISLSVPTGTLLKNFIRFARENRKFFRRN